MWPLALPSLRGNRQKSDRQGISHVGVLLTLIDFICVVWGSISFLLVSDMVAAQELVSNTVKAFVTVAFFDSDKISEWSHFPGCNVRCNVSLLLSTQFKAATYMGIFGFPCIFFFFSPQLILYIRNQEWKCRWNWHRDHLWSSGNVFGINWTTIEVQVYSNFPATLDWFPLKWRLTDVTRLRYAGLTHRQQE